MNAANDSIRAVLALAAKGRPVFALCLDKRLAAGCDLQDVLAFHCTGATVPALPFSAIIKDMKALLHNA